MNTIAEQQTELTDTFDLLKISREERGLVDEASNPYKRLLEEAREKYNFTLSVLTSLTDRINKEIRPKLDRELSAVKALELLNSMYQDDTAVQVAVQVAVQPAPNLPPAPAPAPGGERAKLAFVLGERQRQFVQMIQEKSLELGLPADKVEIAQKEILVAGFPIGAFYANNGCGYRRFVKRRQTGPDTWYSLDEYGLNCYRGGKL